MDLMERVRRSCEDALINTLTGKRRLSSTDERALNTKYNEFVTEVDRAMDRLTDLINNRDFRRGINVPQASYTTASAASPIHTSVSRRSSTPSILYQSTAEQSPALDITRSAQDNNRQMSRKRLLSSRSDVSYEPVRRAPRLGSISRDERSLSPITEIREDVEMNDSRPDETSDSYIGGRKKIVGRKKKLPESFLRETSPDTTRSSRVSQDVTRPDQITFIERQGKRRKIVRKKKKKTVISTPKKVNVKIYTDRNTSQIRDLTRRKVPVKLVVDKDTTTIKNLKKRKTKHLTKKSSKMKKTDNDNKNSNNDEYIEWE
jgi:hypothetical protein